jgi:serine protease Do
MKTRLTTGIIGLLFTMLSSKPSLAQATTEKVIVEAPQVTIKEVNPSSDKETQEIIIRKKGSKDAKVTVEITGNKVMINGKPMAEFKEDGITINNRKIIIRDGDKIIMNFNDDITRMDDDFTRMNDDNTRMLDNLEGMDFNGFGEGETTKSFLGVGTEKDKEGAKIMNVEKASPAEKAGLKVDDIIYKVNDKKVDGMIALSEIITAMKVGDKATVYFLRDGKKQQVDATIGERKNRFSINKVFAYKMPNGKVRSLRVPRTSRIPSMQWPKDFDMKGDFNFDTNGYFNFRKPKLGLKIQDTEEGNGVKVLEVEAESNSAKAGLLKDDVVIEIAGKKVTNTDEAREELKENKDKNTYIIKAKRNGKEMEFTIKIPKKLKTAEL